MSQQASEKRNGIRPVQVIAAALAALTAAFLGSRLGVYGTVAGAGLVSVLTTLGSELYLRSLERTREAARRTKEAALARTGRYAPVATDPTAPPSGEDSNPAELSVEPGTELLDTDRVAEGPPPEPLRRLRLPVLVGGTVLAFGLGMLAVTGIEAFTGTSLSGDQGSSTVGKVLRGERAPAPQTQAPEEHPALATTPKTETVTVPASTTSDVPTTDSAPPSESSTEPGQESSATGEPAPSEDDEGAQPSVGLTR